MEVPDELKVALEFAQKTTKVKGKTAIFAREMVTLLERAVTKLETAESSLMISRPAKGGGEKVVYVVDKVEGREEALAEHRTSGKSNPFRCPKSLYDAIVQVLMTTDRSLSVEDIANEVAKTGVDRPAEFQVRVPLRLWISVQAPLITRNRARYRSSVNSFSTLALHIWSSLRK